MSEDDLRAMVHDKTRDNPTGEDEYISQWVKNIKDVQAELYLLEPDVGDAAEESTNNALEAISNGLDELNQLLDYWPDYKGNDETNETRMSIIQSAAESIGDGIQDVKDTDQDASVLDKVTPTSGSRSWCIQRHELMLLIFRFSRWNKN